MKLQEHKHFQPVMFEGEGAISTVTFVVGARAGAALVEDIEATPMGIVVRRSEGFYDVLLSPCGSSRIAEKRAQQPTQLKGAK